MKSRIKTIFVILIFPLFAYTQNFEGGLSFGLVTYQGDLVDGSLELKETNLSYGLVLRAALTDKFGLRGSFFGGTISGKDANSSNAGIQSRGFKFRSNIYEFSLMGEWNILGQSRSDNRGVVLRQKFTPYLFGGVGLILSDPEVFQNTTKDPEGRDYNTFNLMIPVGIGLKVGLDDRFVVSLELGGRTAFTDYLDGISQLGNPDKKDWYWMGNIIFTYTFGEPSFF